jgi:hypothetical protein
MINFKISDLSAGLITVTKPVGKPISLNVGEIIKADVMDLLSSGGVTLRIKGSYITARTDMPVQKDSQIMLKVLASPSAPNELRLQFLGNAENDQPGATGSQNEAIGRLVNEMSGLNAKNLSAERIANLIKTLPADISQIPKDVRTQLMSILQEGLQSTGRDIQSRIDALFRDLPAAFKSQSFIQGLQLDVTSSAEKLLSDGLKGLLRDTGVALESKLKAIAELLQPASKGMAEVEASKAASFRIEQGGDIKSLISTADRISIENDLKTNLLRLRETLTTGSDALSQKDVASGKSAITGIDGMLRDIESYQLMSRATGSFYTFLPVSWQELKDGEIAFKSNNDDEKTPSSSCRLTLDLDGFGKLMIMVLMHGNEFLVSLKPEKTPFKELLASNIGALDEQFKEKGLTLKAVRVLDYEDTSLEGLENLEPFRQIVNIKA